MLELPHDLLAAAPPPATPRLAARYNQLLDTAARFATLDYPEVDVTLIASEANVSSSTAYRFFPSAAHLLLALHRRQLLELRERVDQRAGRAQDRTQRVRHLVGAAIELFHMRLAQPAVNSCLDELIVPADHDLAALIGEVDELSWSVLGRLAGGAERGRNVVLVISGLVTAVRTGRLLPLEAEQQLKASCELVAKTPSLPLR
ncbi:TetR/AcrR family transcriptional regulator [Sinomonas halotolerans]|uniref:TetR/AcrR family transcriptional regulator n=1 Tax=Sinomonas halotolerans TaxID=1644133 RepID=A0ABU9X254_9MICC